MPSVHVAMVYSTRCQAILPLDSLAVLRGASVVYKLKYQVSHTLYVLVPGFFLFRDSAVYSSLPSYILTGRFFSPPRPTPVPLSSLPVSS